jgi:hypothetical protein
VTVCDTHTRSRHEAIGATRIEAPVFRGIGRPACLVCFAREEQRLRADVEQLQRVDRQGPGPVHRIDGQGGVVACSDPIRGSDGGPHGADRVRQLVLPLDERRAVDHHRARLVDPAELDQARHSISDQKP